MDIIKRILGEADEVPRTDEIEKDEEAEGASSHSEKAVPEESDIDQLAALWAQGNHDEVARRFMQMSNETAVKVVFAIGREGALELARMVDEILERMGDHEGVTPPDDLGEVEAGGGESAEPESVTPPSEPDYPVRQITGRKRV